jgi:AsmA protein
MAKPFKIFLWIVGSFVALLALCAVVLTLVFNPNDYKDDAARAAKEKTGRELEIKGDMKLTLYPWLGASVSDVQLANAEGFGPEPMLRVGQINVGVKLMPLFKDRVEVAKIRVDGLTLNLEQKADGTNNWADLSRNEAEHDHDRAREERDRAVREATQDRKPMEVSINGVEIKDVSLSYTDRKSGEAYKIDKLSIETGAIKPGDPIDVVIAFLVNSAKPQLESDVKISFTAAGGEPGSEVTELRNIKVDTTSKGPGVPGGSQKATLSGQARNDRKQGTFTFTDGVLEAAGLTLYATVNGTGLDGENPSLTGKIATNTFNPKELAKSFGAELPPTADPRALTQASFNAAIAGDPANIKLDSLTLRLDQTTATGGLSVRNLSDPRIDFALKADSFDLDRYLAAESTDGPKQEGGGGDFKSTPIPVEALDALNMAGTVDLASLKMKGLNLTDIHVVLDAPKGQAKTQQMTALLYGGKITQSSRFVRNSPVKYDMKIGLDAVNSAPLLKDMLGKSWLSGLGDLNLNLSSGGETVGAFLQAMDGGLGASFKEGAIEGFNLDQTIASAKATFRGEPAPAADQPKRTAFKDLKAAGKIVDGVLDTDTLDVKGTWYSLGGDGKVNLVEQTLAYTLLPTFSSEKHKDLKGIKVPIAVTGSWYAPQVKVDLKGAVKGAAKEELKQQETKIKEKAKSKLDDFLNKKLAPKPAPTPAPAPAPAETKPAEPAAPAPAPTEEPKTETPPPSGG